MDINISFEWNEEIGLKLSDLYTFRENIEEFFKEKFYGKSVQTIWILLNALGYDVKQRKRFKKDLSRFEYDIMLDYFLIKNVGEKEKTGIIKKQVIEITEHTISKYKFDDFDKDMFLLDFKNIVNATVF